jgi:hypothetical protein
MKYEMKKLDKPLPRMPKGTFRGELYSAAREYIGNIYKVDGGYRVYKLQEMGRGERVAEIPCTFRGGEFEYIGRLDVGYAVVKQYMLKD